MATVLYPGSFDPLHNGHVDVVEEAKRLFGPVVVAAMRNPQKADPAFSEADRRAMVEESLAHVPGTRVVEFGGLVVDLARDLDVDFIVKGLRTPADFDVELQMAHTNRAVTGVRTVFLPCSAGHAHLSSRFIREIARAGGDVSMMVPPPVARRLKERYHR